MEPQIENTGSHFVCPECGGTSDIAKSCSTPNCHLAGMPLEQCTCQDGKHVNILNENA